MQWKEKFLPDSFDMICAIEIFEKISTYPARQIILQKVKHSVCQGKNGIRTVTIERIFLLIQTEENLMLKDFEVIDMNRKRR